MIDKERLNADEYSYSGGSVASKARACAFFGVTVALGSIGGALVCSFSMDLNAILI